jgi:putative transposase
MIQEFKNWLIDRGNSGAAQSYPGAINKISNHYSENTGEYINIYTLRDHLHCIWTLPPDDADFGVRWAMIKRFVAKQCDPELKHDAWMKPSKRKRKEATL